MSEETKSSTNEQDVKDAQGVSEATAVSEPTGEETRANERIRELAAQNKILLKLVDTTTARQAPAAASRKKPENLDPETEQYIQGVVGDAKNEAGQIIGGTLDKLDEMEAKSDVPGFSNKKSGVKESIDELREEYRGRGIYLKRVDAYGILLGRGVLKADSGSVSTAKKSAVEVDKGGKETKVVTETKTSDNRRPGTKPFSQMTVAEKEEALGDQKF